VSTALRFFKDTYLDSVLQLSGTRAMRAFPGVAWAAAAMATPANLGTLTDEGFDPAELTGIGANDLFIAVRADDEAALEGAVTAGEKAMFAAREAALGDGIARLPRTLAEAVERQPGSNVAVVSVPGDYAALEAHKALSAGLHVLLFSDNVSVVDEIGLKEHARRRALLLMGPGAGTAMLGQACLGFANVVRPGRVGVIAAGGTGAQEVASLLDRWGVGVSQVIGLGGRDLSDAIGGAMAKMAIEALTADESTDAILLVSKPPAPRVAKELLGMVGRKPFVASMIGLTPDFDVPVGARVVATLEEGVVEIARRVGVTVPERTAIGGRSIEEACRLLADERVLVLGFYSGGTLCYEALALLERVLGPVYSNTPIDKSHGLPAPDFSHVCLDLGEEEYTKGRPHPMIDPEARIEMLREHGRDADIAVVLMDVVLGYGAHHDPAGMLAPVCADLMADGGPQVVAYVLGTELDPQVYSEQRRKLEAVGCIVTETAARAALAAAAVASRTPSLLQEAL
jgi:FdrA protein